MDTHNVPDMYANSPQASRMHIRQIPCAHVTTITYYFKMLNICINLDVSVHISPPFIWCTYTTKSDAITICIHLMITIITSSLTKTLEGQTFTKFNIV